MLYIKLLWHWFGSSTTMLMHCRKTVVTSVGMLDNSLYYFNHKNIGKGVKHWIYIFFYLSKNHSFAFSAYFSLNFHGLHVPLCVNSVFFIGIRLRSTRQSQPSYQQLIKRYSGYYNISEILPIADDGALAGRTFLSDMNSCVV